jgi:hypothetical protein
MNRLIVARGRRRQRGKSLSSVPRAGRDDVARWLDDDGDFVALENEPPNRLIHFRSAGAAQFSNVGLRPAEGEVLSAKWQSAQ